MIDPIKPLKIQMRSEMLAQRLSLSRTDQEERAKQLTENILKLPEFLSSLQMAAYWPLHTEISPIAILQAAHARGIKCYLPRMHSQTRTLDFVAYEPGDPLIAKQTGILEPIITAHESLEATDLDLVLVPLVAFDEQGHRLGTGGGYYDRTFGFLKSNSNIKKPFLLGIAYELQCVKTIPVNDWDIQLNGIVTEQRVIRIS